MKLPWLLALVLTLCQWIPAESNPNVVDFIILMWKNSLKSVQGLVGDASMMSNYRYRVYKDAQLYFDLNLYICVKPVINDVYDVFS